MKDYLTTSNVYWNKFDFTVIKQMSFKESELDKCTVTKGDLLVCEGGDIGRSAIWNYDYDIAFKITFIDFVQRLIYVYHFTTIHWRI